MIQRAFLAIAAAVLVAAPTATAAVTPYTQNFEGLVASNPAALSGDGWVVYGNVYTPAHVYMYGYGPYPAPNGGNSFSDIDTGQGGVEQGAQQLVVYSDYNNTAHAAGNLVESNVYREQTITPADVGGYWSFQFDAKLGNLVAPSTALAFIKTLDPGAGYATTNFITYETTALPTSWGTYKISIPIVAGLVGQLVQFGFSNTATSYVSSGIFYDNVYWFLEGTLGVDDAGGPSAIELKPAPNPFRQSTRLEFSLARRGFADISIYDVGGRRVAGLFRGVAEAGPHAAIWEGRLENGDPAPAGVYHGVLRTETGHVTRTIVLTR